MNIQTSIFLIICALCLGIAVGGYIASLLHEKKPDNRAAESQLNDLIRLRKDPASEALEVIVAGQSFHSPAEMNNVQRTLAGYAANDLRAWLSPQAVAVQSGVNSAPAATPSTAVTADSAAVAASVAASATLTALPAAPSSGQVGGVVEENLAAEDPKKRKRGSVVEMITRALKADVPTLRPVPKSIAIQVNEVLQEKLKDTPLANRGICLMELPGQEMFVMIGLDKYDSVNAVPDDEIRRVIQSAVNEWSTRSS